ncbi:MAG: TetR/AcrR family transcriptional regulator [Oscillospiraceae bacterium]|nr:TetR/AcrR family transcriptional regulator [Oscillospiraceae bacterium]
MNDSFFSLPQEKRNAIINAGFRVFSQNSYKKSPVSEIALEAGISKALLFYYFKNKKELYLFLLGYGAKVTHNELKKQGCYDKGDFFEVFLSGLRVKAELMRKYPELSMFQMRAYYEKEPELRRGIDAVIAEYSGYERQADALKLEPRDFIEGLDLEMMYRDIYLASQGYLWECFCAGKTDIDKMERDFIKMAEFWKSVYKRRKQ